MGLFSGGFLGSGSDESSTVSTTTTNVTTEQTTQVHDIGLTGQAAVDLANVISGNIGATLAHISDSTFSAVMQIQNQGQQILSDVGARQETAQQQIFTTFKETTNPALTLAEGQQKLVLYGLIALAALFAFGMGR